MKFIDRIKKMFVRVKAPRASNGQYLRKVPIKQYGRVVDYVYMQPRKEGVRFAGEVARG